MQDFIIIEYNQSVESCFFSCLLKRNIIKLKMYTQVHRSTHGFIYACVFKYKIWTPYTLNCLGRLSLIFKMPHQISTECSSPFSLVKNPPSLQYFYLEDLTFPPQCKQRWYISLKSKKSVWPTLFSHVTSKLEIKYLQFQGHSDCQASWTISFRHLMPFQDAFITRK